MWAVAGLTMIAIALIVWSTVASRSGGAATAAGNQAPESTFNAEDMNPIAGINEPARSPGDVQDLLSQSEEGRLEFVNERGEVVRELLYDRLEPREGGRVEVTHPQAWLHLANGALAHLEAARGSLLQPQGRSEPESGRFAGGVTIKVYDNDPRSKTNATAEHEPVLEFTTEALNFDTTMGEARSVEPVQIHARGIAVTFTGFTLVFDEARQRLALFESLSPGKAVLDPDAMESSSRAGNDAQASAAGQSDAVADLLETLYHTVVTGDVLFASGNRHAQADQLDMWTRLFDNQFSPRTVAGLRAVSFSSSSGSARTDESATSSISPTRSPAGEVITLTWTDGLTIKPLEETPDELLDEDALVQLASPSGGVVKLADEDAKFSSQSVSFAYAVASRIAVWTGIGPKGVILRAQDTFEALSGRIELDLAAGLATFPGPGLIRSFPADPSAVDPDRPITPSQISWRRRSDIVLASTEQGVDFTAQPMLTRALFTGDAEASDGAVTMTGEQLQTFFALDVNDDTSISRAIITGSARADAGAEGLLTADRIDIEFDLTDTAGSVPTTATAAGDVRAAQAGSTLRADLAEARFRRNDLGRLVVDSFTANLGVVVNTNDGVTATASSLRATPATGVIDLEGQPASVGSSGAVVTGSSLRIEQKPRILTVFGAGALERNSAQTGLGYDTLKLQWQDSMKYDDLIGHAVFQGLCVLTADKSELARDVVRASRIEIDTHPYAHRGAGAGEMPILRAVAIGGDNPDQPGSAAQIESRRYEPDATTETGLRLTRLVYLDGPTIIADAEHDELRVPAAGRLLIENRSAAHDGSASNPTASRGTTLVQWDGSFLLKQRVGSADFRRRVRVRHRPLGAAKVTELESERLELAFDAGSTPGAGLTDMGDLMWAQAQGAVYVAQGRRQVIADRLLYDDSLGYAELTAWPSNTVTLYDSRTPTPLVGKLLRWDLISDRVEWRGAQAASAPD